MSSVLSLRPSYYEALRQLTQQLAGIRMGSDHAFLVETRLSSLARKEGFDTLDAMVQELFASGQSRLAIQVVSALVERDTHFNRDPKSFDALFDAALPDLVAKRGGGRIDLLCYGCGSGQDVFSIAMRARKAEARQMLAPVSLHLKGVDYPSQALDRARAGRYTHYEVQRGLSVRDMIANFAPDPAPGSTDWIAADHLRDKVSFEDMHLMSGPDEIATHHVVMFRSSLSHYTQAAKLRVLRTLTKVLKPHGYLVLGSGEDLGSMHGGLEKVEGYAHLYRRLTAEAEQPMKSPNGRTTFDSPQVHRAAG